MSAITPDHILNSIALNARGIGGGPIVTKAEWQRYARDLDGWFMWDGQAIDMKLKSFGAGLYRIHGEVRK